MKNKSVTKENLLFLHGYLSSKDSFIYQIKYFERFFNVYALDLKGFGDNKDMEYPYSLDDYCKEVLDFLSKNGIKKTHVLAHSFGGRIAIKIASDSGDIFDKIVLTGSAGLKPKRSVKYYVKKKVFKFLSLFIKKEKLKMFYSKDYNMLSPVMKESFVKIVGEYLDDNLKNIKNKTLIINGALDKETPPYTARRLNENIKNSTLIFIKGASHFAFIDKPFEFNTEVGEFLLSN